MIETIIAQLEHHTAARSSGFTVAVSGEGAAPLLPVALAEIEAERLVWRLLATLAGAAAPGEMLGLMLEVQEESVLVSMQLPEALASRDDTALFHAAPTTAQQALSAGMFGTGFALRLAASEAKAAGGSLERHEEKLQLALPISGPGLTALSHDHSQGAASGNVI